MSPLRSLFSRQRPFDFSGQTDWHSHILPGVDDGVQTIEDSLAILSEYEQMGIHTVWLTPHIMEDMPNTPETLRESFEELQTIYTGPIRLNLAAENMLDNLFSERLEKNDLLPIGNRQDILLVETSYFNPPMDFDNIFERIKSKGYHPLLAHPERYNFIDSISEYKRIKEKGILFQLNLLSLTGYYGKAAKEKSHRLLKSGLYNYIGSDIHRPAQLALLTNLSLPSDQLRALSKLTGYNEQ